MDLREAAAEFLSQRRIAVAGVSRSPGQAANIIYTRLRGTGYHVYAVNPNAESVEGDRSYPNLTAIEEAVTAVVIATHPRVSVEIVGECATLGIPRVWIHRSFGRGSVSDEAVRFGRESGIRVIPGGCPMMFLPSTDLPHTCMRWFLEHTGRLPDVEEGPSGTQHPDFPGGLDPSPAPAS